MEQPLSSSSRRYQAEAKACRNVGQGEQQSLDVLRLLLLWVCAESKHNKAVLCKLLCCSTTTRALVHETCAGQVAVCMYLLEAGPAPRQLCTWLAKHAQLLGQLEIVCSMYRSSEKVEECAAAGLRAAAGVASMRPAAAAGVASMRPAAAVPSSSRPTRPDPAQLIQKAEATAQRTIQLMQPQLSVQHSSAQPAGVSMLPLLELKLSGALEGTLLPTISACCQHLTHLELLSNRTSSFPPGSGVPVSRHLTFLHNLTQLRDLRVSRGMFSPLKRADLSCFSSLEHLTKLELDLTDCDLPSFADDSARHLPLTLVDMSMKGSAAQSLPDLQRLTNLTRLQANSVWDPSKLPAQLQELNLDWFEWKDGYLQLPQLKTLQIKIESETLPDLAPLTAWTHLTALSVIADNMGCEFKQAVSGICEELPGLPLVSLQASNDLYTDYAVQQLGECTQLTKLELGCTRLWLSVGAFAEQLQKLQGLECLELDSVSFRPKPQLASDVQPRVDAIRQLCGKRLRQVKLSDLMLSLEQQSVLRQLLGSSLEYQEGRQMSESCDELDSDEYFERFL